MSYRNILVLSLIGITLLGCGSSVPPAAGVWDVELTTPQGAQQVSLTIVADGSGTLAGGPLAGQTINGISFDGNNVSFDISVAAQGQSLTLSFNGVVDGDSIEGEIDTPLGVSLSFSGSRQ